MAVKISRATGNWLTAGTWGTVDATSYNNTESTTTALTTSYQASAGTTTGVETLDGVALKLSVRTGTTGTMSVHLAIAGVEVVGTLVTINTADLPVAATADLNGGWIFFKFASPVTLAGATSYTVEAKTSSASQVSLFCTSGSDWARAFCTTTTGAPVAGDDVIICGEYTGAGTSNSFTVTMNETATTDYGAASTSLVTPSLAICSKGTLSYGTTATTNYYLRQSGNVIVYSGGTFNIGTTGTPIPRDGSAILNFDCGANVDFGLTVRNLGTFNSQGLSRTVSNTTFYCKLNTDEAINSTSLGVDTDTGWLDNDVIAVASTTRTGGDSESGALNGAAGASTLTVDGFAGAGGGLAVAHSGTSPTQAEVILLTRNIQIFGASSSLQGYIDIKPTATVDVDWTEFKWLGSATSNKRGIDCGVTTGSVSIQYSSIHDFSVASSLGFNVSASTSSGWTFSNNVTYNTASTAFGIVPTTGTWTADTNIFIKASDSGTNLVSVGDYGGTFTNITVVSATSSGILFSTDNGTAMGTFNNITVHSNTGGGVNDVYTSTGFIRVFSNFTMWRNGGGWLFNSSNMPGGLTINTGTFFGNTTQNINAQSNAINLVTLNSVTFSGDSTFATTNGINTNGGALTNWTLNSCDFGTVSGIKTAHTNDFNISGAGYLDILLRNTKLASATEITGQSTMAVNAKITLQKHDQTAGLHKTWKKYGTIAIEGTITHSGSTSFSMTPNNASSKLESGSFFIPVANGAALTPSVYSYENATYNGNRMRLILKRNDAIGITSDTVIDTRTGAADAVWEALTGATAAATDDGVMEFVVDCDGTAGIAYVDTFTVT